MEKIYLLKVYYKGELLPIKEFNEELNGLLVFRSLVSSRLKDWQYVNDSIKNINDAKAELYCNGKLIKEYSPIDLKSYSVNPDNSIIFDNEYIAEIHKGMCLINSNIPAELLVTNKSRRQLNELCKVVKRVPKYLKQADSLNGLDYMMAPLIEELNNKGIATVYSCDGHFKKGAEILFKGFVDPKCFTDTKFYLDYFTNANGIDITRITSKTPKSAIEHLLYFSEFVNIILNINYEYVSQEELNGYSHFNVCDRTYNKEIRITGKDKEGAILENNTRLKLTEITYINRTYGKLNFKIIGASNAMDIF